MTVSPSACKNEFNATTNINKIVPKKITLIYLRPRPVTSFEEFINKNTFSPKVKPSNETINEIITA